MKTARILVAAYWLSCPECLEPISNPETDSQMWASDEGCPSTVECDSCGVKVRVPQKVQEVCN